MSGSSGTAIETTPPRATSVERDGPELRGTWVRTPSEYHKAKGRLTQ